MPFLSPEGWVLVASGPVSGHSLPFSVASDASLRPQDWVLLLPALGCGPGFASRW